MKGKKERERKEREKVKGKKGRKEKKEKRKERRKKGNEEGKQNQCRLGSRTRQQRTWNYATRGRFPPTPVILRLGVT